jgi:secreted trypsin-like serine protease
MKRLRSSLAVGVLAVLACASSGLPATRVVGGSGTQIQSAPWTVSIRQQAGANVLLCSGSVVDASHILTAAHCVYNQNGVPAAAGSLSVRAGISNYTTPLSTDAEQDRTVTVIRVHPGYVWSNSASPDDIAVLGLANPLDFSGASVQASALLTSG